MTIPQSYVEQNHLDTGSLVCPEINGSELRVKPGRRRPQLSDLLASTPGGLCRVEGWDGMPATGAEL